MEARDLISDVAVMVNTSQTLVHAGRMEFCVGQDATREVNAVKINN